MDSTLGHSYDLARPWRRATFVAGSVAAVEFVLLIVVGASVLARPVERLFAGSKAPVVASHRAKPAEAPVHRLRATMPIATKLPARDNLKVLVLNGNGRNGAAATAAGRLHRLGYKIAGTANAARQNYSTSLVMYRPGYREAGLRLARDLGVKVVGPLDGMRAASLDGGELTVILGA